MNDQTTRKLNAINRAFYASQATEFDQTRTYPWRGFELVIQTLTSRVAGGACRVLDVGCGNGRFGQSLFEQIPDAKYVAIDASDALLSRARSALDAQRGQTTFLKWDLVESDSFLAESKSGLGTAFPGQTFDLIAVFGLLHHLPGLALRLRILENLVPYLAEEGLLVLTFWRMRRARLIAWEQYNQVSDDPIDLSELELGDHLVAWGRGSMTCRYCHLASDSEIALFERVGRRLGLEVVSSFDSDGPDDRDNRYMILGRAHR